MWLWYVGMGFMGVTLQAICDKITKLSKSVTLFEIQMSVGSNSFRFTFDRYRLTVSTFRVLILDVTRNYFQHCIRVLVLVFVNIMYTNAELVDIVLMYGECMQNAHQAAAEYRRRFPNRHSPNPRTFVKTVQRLRDTGSFAVVHRERGAPPADINVIERKRLKHGQRQGMADSQGKSVSFPKDASFSHE